MNGASEWCGYFGPQTRYDMKNRVKRMGLSNLYGPDTAFLEDEDRTKEPELDMQHRMTQKTTQDVLLENAGAAVITAPEIVQVAIPDTLDERIINHMFTAGEFANYSFNENLWK